MSDLTSRQAAIDLHCEICGRRGRCNPDICVDMELFRDLPSAQPKGRWRLVTKPTDSFDGYRCSECNELVYGKTSFCPGCGADMRGEEDEQKD